MSYPAYQSKDFKVSLVFSEEKVDALVDEISNLSEMINRMNRLLMNFEKFHSYPKWLTKDQALEILPISSFYELKKWVRRGVIKQKEASDGGKIRVYLKSDCLEFPERVEDWRIRGAIDPKSFN